MPETVLPDDPFLIDGVSVSTGEMRRQISGLLAHDANHVSARAGVLYGFHIPAINSTTRVVTFPAGTAVVTPAAGSAASYIASSGTTVNVTLDARDSVNPRIDLAVIRVYNETSRKEAVLEVITGTAAAQPTAPSVPAGTLPLWSFQVPVSGTIIATDLRFFTASAGGVIPCVSTSKPTGPYLRSGCLIYETDLSRLNVWTGSEWLARSAEGNILTGSGDWRLSGLSQQGSRSADGTVTLYIEARSQSAIPFDSRGSISDLLVGTLSNYPWLRPAKTQWTTFEYTLSDGHSMTGGLRVDTNGALYIIDGRPSTTIAAQSTSPSIRVGITYQGQ